MLYCKTDLSLLCPINHTYLVEIILPENKIVVNYGNIKDLILLAIINTETGEEVCFEEFNMPFTCRKVIEGVKDFTKLTEVPRDNEEGFVITYDNGFRVKMKFAEYVRLHRLITGVNERRIWDILRNRESLDDLLDRVPDEFYKWVKETKERLESDFSILRVEAMIIQKEAEKLSSRKEQALYILEKNKQLSGVVFNLLDGKKEKAEDYIWKLIKPKAEKFFKVIL